MDEISNMLQSLKDRIKEGKVGYKVPKRTQDLIPIQRIFGSSGIFLVDNRFTKTFRFKDINYQMTSREYREDICIHKWASIINGMDDEAIIKITLFNRPTETTDIDDGIYIDTTDLHCSKMLMQAADEFNKLIDEKAGNRTGMLQDKFLTISIKRDSLEDAVSFFDRIEEDLANDLQDMGSDLTPLNTDDRLFVLHSFFHRGDEYRPVIDPDSPYFGKDFKDYIAPEYLKKHWNHLKVDDKFVRGFYFISYPNIINDTIISTISAVSENMVLSMDIIPVPTDEATKLVRDVERQADYELSSWQESSGNPNGLPPQSRLNKQDGSRQWDEDLTQEDEKMLLVCITITLTEDNMETLDKTSAQLRKAVRSASGSGSNLIETATFQQQQTLDTCLPYGCWRTPQLRTMNTSALSVLTPFKCLDIQEKGGIYIGDNEISHNQVVINMDSLINQSCIMTGKPGGGKSMLIKWIQLQRILKTDRKYIIVDPEGEYAALYKVLCPEICTVVNIANGKDRLNCMEMVKDYGIESASIADSPALIKSNFLISLLNLADPGHPISLIEKSILDRCTSMMYPFCEQRGYLPCLATLREIVVRQKEEEAKTLALKLEIFTNGSFNMFGQDSNVDIYGSRVVIFDLHGLREAQKAVGLFVLSDAIINMVTRAWSKGETAYIDFDEAQVLLSDPNTKEFFDGAYRQWRKRSGIPNAITQNARVFMTDDICQSMLSNSEVVFMLSQSPSDLEALREYYNLSEEQTRWLKKSRVGSGLLKYGDNFIPFTNKIPDKTLIYKLFSTKRTEGVFGNESYRS